MYGQVCSPVCECTEIRGQCQVPSIAPHRASYSLKLGGQQEPGMLPSPSPRAGVTEGQPGLCVRWALDSFPCDYAVAVILPLSHLSHPDPKVLKGEKGFTGSPGLRHRRGDRQDLWWRWHWYCPRTDKLTKGSEQRVVYLPHIHRKRIDDKGSITIKEETEIQQSDGAESWRRNRHCTQNEANSSSQRWTPAPALTYK